MGVITIVTGLANHSNSSNHLLNSTILQVGSSGTYSTKESTFWEVGRGGYTNGTLVLANSHEDLQTLLFI